MNTDKEVQTQDKLNGKTNRKCLKRKRSVKKDDVCLGASCACKRRSKCKTEKCTCRRKGVICTDACKCCAKSCQNFTPRKSRKEQRKQSKVNALKDPCRADKIRMQNKRYSRKSRGHKVVKSNKENRVPDDDAHLPEQYTDNTKNNCIMFFTEVNVKDIQTQDKQNGITNRNRCKRKQVGRNVDTSCACKRRSKCKTEKCRCRRKRVICTDSCKCCLKSCQNFIPRKSRNEQRKQSKVIAMKDPDRATIIRTQNRLWSRQNRRNTRMKKKKENKASENRNINVSIVINMTNFCMLVFKKSPNNCRY